MLREGTLQEISDGRLYTVQDMAKLGCGDCAGCSACCHHNENTVQLDPRDVFRMTQGTGKGFETLVGEGVIALGVVDGLILPHLNHSGPDEGCPFLNDAGRCRIHPYRPGICRLFPLGRVYEGDSFSYFLQIDQCLKENRTKVKIRRWIDEPDLSSYERFIRSWHSVLVKTREGIGSDEERRAMSVKLLKLFYMIPYDVTGDFYEQFEKRLQQF